MPSWKDQYLSSLKDVELNTPVNLELVDACSQMAARIAALEAERAMLEAEKAKLESQAPAGKKTPPTQSTATTTDDPGVTQLRLDLAEAVRAKGVTETRLRTADEELKQLRAKTKNDSKSLRDLVAQASALTTRLQDREHELREKRKLIENVQDEMITLNLQLSIAEKERDRVQKENKELVDRWMKRMGQEADAMNLANEPLFEKGR